MDQSGECLLMLSYNKELSCVRIATKEILTTMNNCTDARINNTGTRLFIIRQDGDLKKPFICDLVNFHIMNNLAQARGYCAFDPAGAVFLTNENDTVSLWNADRGYCFYLDGFSSLINFVVFSHSGDILLLVYADKAPEIFHARKFVTICTLPRYFSEITSAAFGTDDDTVIALLHGQVIQYNFGSSLRVFNAFCHRQLFTRPQKGILRFIDSLLTQKKEMSAKKIKNSKRRNFRRFRNTLRKA